MTETTLYRLSSRALIRLAGDEAVPLIDDIVTADIGNLPPGMIRPGALLTPQGRILFDMNLSRDGDDILIETDAERRDALISKLKLYRLRRAVDITPDDRPVHAVTGQTEGMLPDPRFPFEAGRFYGEASQAEDEDAFTRLRWQHGIFEGSAELTPEKALPLEARLDLDEGISFEKGCYIGQEVTARTRYRGLVKRSFVPVRLNTPAGQPIETPQQITAEGKDAGDLLASLPDGKGRLGLASVRLAFLNNDDAVSLKAGDVAVTPILPPRLKPLPGAE